MEVRVIPQSGCMNIVLGVFTLGIAPLAIKMKERSWPKIVDEQGLETRGGKRIAWNEFTKFEKVVTNVQGTVTTRYDLHSPQGLVSLVIYRLEDGQKVLDYVWERLPESAKQA
jgi:hypothetical protein